MTSAKNWCRKTSWRWNVCGIFGIFDEHVRSHHWSLWNSKFQMHMIGLRPIDTHLLCLIREEVRQPAKDHPEPSSQDFYDLRCRRRSLGRAELGHQYDLCRLLISCRCADWWRPTPLGDMDGMLTETTGSRRCLLTWSDSLAVHCDSY